MPLSGQRRGFQSERFGAAFKCGERLAISRWTRWVERKLSLVVAIAIAADTRMQASDWQAWEEAERYWSICSNDVEAERKMTNSFIANLHIADTAACAGQGMHIDLSSAQSAVLWLWLWVAAVLAVLPPWRALMTPLHAHELTPHDTCSVLLCAGDKWNVHLKSIPENKRYARPHPSSDRGERDARRYFSHKAISKLYEYSPQNMQPTECERPQPITPRFWLMLDAFFPLGRPHRRPEAAKRFRTAFPDSELQNASHHKFGTLQVAAALPVPGCYHTHSACISFCLHVCRTLNCVTAMTYLSACGLHGKKCCMGSGPSGDSSWHRHATIFTITLRRNLMLRSSMSRCGSIQVV